LLPFSPIISEESSRQKWVIGALKKASRTKGKLYKIWTKYKSKEDEENYKTIYRMIFKKLSREKEALF